MYQQQKDTEGQVKVGDEADELNEPIEVEASAARRVLTTITRSIHPCLIDGLMYVPFRVLGSSLSCLGVFEGSSFSFFMVSDLRSSFSGSSFSSLPFF